MTGQEGVTRLPANAAKQEPVPDHMLRDGSVVFNEWADFAADVLKGGQEGAIWVGLDQTYYLKPKVDAKLVLNVSKNNYVTEQIERMRRLLFTDRPSFEVLDTTLPADDQENKDEELSERLTEMFEAKDVRVFKAMQQAWVDIFNWGCSLWNPVWGRDDNGSAVLLKLRRLPPESFAAPALSDTGKVYSSILKGITLDKDEETVQFWQRNTDNAAPVQIKNVWMLTDPTSTELAGTSKLAPLVPVIEALNFCMKAQMQYVNRTGAPIAFIKVSSPVKTGNRDDLALAKKLIKNWGKDTGYIMPDNMDLVVIDIKGGGNPLASLEYFERRIKVYMSPAPIISTDGPTMGEGTGAKLDLMHEWLKGEHNWLEGDFEELGDAWLEHNLYTDRRTDVEIPEPQPDNTQVDMQRAEKGHATQSMLKDEIRELLGLDPLKQEERQMLEQEYASQPPSPMFALPPGSGHGPPRGAPRPGMGPGSPAAGGEPQHTGWPGSGEPAMFQNPEYVENPELTIEMQRITKRAEDRVVAAFEEEMERNRDDARGAEQP